MCKYFPIRLLLVKHSLHIDMAHAHGGQEFSLSAEGQQCVVIRDGVPHPIVQAKTLPSSLPLRGGKFSLNISPVASSCPSSLFRFIHQP